MPGPIITRSDQRTYARERARDTSAQSPGLSDPQWNRLLDRSRFAYAQKMENDETLFAYDTVALAQGANTVDLTFTYVPLSLEALYLNSRWKLKAEILPLILAYQNENPDGIGTPQQYAVDAGGSRSTWRFYFPVKADAGYTVSAWYRKEAVAYASDADTTPYGDGAAWTIADMAAVMACTPLGRSGDFASGLAAALPDALKAAMSAGFRVRTHGGTEPRRAP